MWFNPYAKLAEIAGHPPATSATTATQAQPARAVSQVSQLSQAPSAQKRCAPANVADVATVATPEHHPHGIAFDGRPKTWTGRVVSLAAWRMLTEWERHGPKGQHWNGITRQWEQPKGMRND
ncbi:MAG: hypothetical protein KBT76_05885 [Sulfitobacter litoralis]|nr:hypothetical protein [Sulfitobacter litoralis]MBQ0801251.1 hypothetical protein [Sulfitobacter litoralis]